MEQHLSNCFSLNISGTAHGEWQGNLRTSDGRELPFRSVLELIVSVNEELGLTPGENPLTEGNPTHGTD
jgi:hypothetical protein